MNNKLLVLFFLLSDVFLVSCDDEIVTHGYISIRRSQVKNVLEYTERTPEIGDSLVTKVSCCNGTEIKSYHELGFFRVFYATGTVEKTYVDQERYPLWHRVIKYSDGWRQVVFRDGKVVTQNPDGSYEKSNT